MQPIKVSSPAGTLPGSISRPDEAARQSRSGSVSEGSVHLQWAEDEQPGGWVHHQGVQVHDLPGVVPDLVPDPVPAAVGDQADEVPLAVPAQPPGPAAPAFDIEAQPLEGAVREEEPFCSETTKCVTGVLTSVCAVVGATIAGGVLAFTSHDDQTIEAGAWTFGMGVSVILGAVMWTCCSA